MLQTNAFGKKDFPESLMVYTEISIHTQMSKHKTKAMLIYETVNNMLQSIRTRIPCNFDMWSRVNQIPCVDDLK